MLITAIEAARIGVDVVGWAAPGSLKVIREQRGNLVHAEYGRIILEMRSKGEL